MKNLILLTIILSSAYFVNAQDLQNGKKTFLKLAECKIISSQKTVIAFVPEVYTEGDTLFIEYEPNFKGCVANWLICDHNTSQNKNFEHTITVWNSLKGKSELKKVKVYKAIFVKEKKFDPIIN